MIFYPAYSLADQRDNVVKGCFWGFLPRPVATMAEAKDSRGANAPGSLSLNLPHSLFCIITAGRCLASSQ